MADLALSLAGLWLLISLSLWWTLRRRYCRDQFRELSAADRQELPGLSIVVAACNEEAAIEACLSSLLKLDYPHFEIVAVNDRSSDGTGAIMDAMAEKSNGQLQIIHIKELPPHWLGKNHALQKGAEKSRYPWILFTDGDIIFSPKVLQQALDFSERKALDHLAIVPGFIRGSYWENSCIGYFGMLMLSGLYAPLIRSKLTFAYIGIGAFNLIRREVYNSFEGHKKIRMDLADDLKLGHLVKVHGFRQDFLVALDEIKVRWHQGVWALIRGLEKNLFAGLRFNVFLLFLAVFVQLLLVPAVYLGALFYLYLGQAEYFPFVLALFFQLSIAAYFGWRSGYSPSHALGGFVAALILVFAILRSAFLTLKQGGIWWRHTFYSLSDLRRYLYR